MGREGGAQETELAPATGTGPWLTKVRKTIDGTTVGVRVGAQPHPNVAELCSAGIVGHRCGQVNLTVIISVGVIGGDTGNLYRPQTES